MRQMEDELRGTAIYGEYKKQVWREVGNGLGWLGLETWCPVRARWHMIQETHKCLWKNHDYGDGLSKKTRYWVHTIFQTSLHYGLIFNGQLFRQGQLFSHLLQWIHYDENLTNVVFWTYLEALFHVSLQNPRQFRIDDFIYTPITAGK